MDKILIVVAAVILCLSIVILQHRINEGHRAQELLIEKQKEYITTLQEGLKETTQQLSAAEQIIEDFGLDAYKKNKYVHVTVTSYNPTPAQGWGDGLHCYTGKLATPGIISISHDLKKKHGIKLGQKVILGQYGQFIVGDFMNKRFTKRVDIISLVPAWSKKFGVKKAKLYYPT